MLAKISCFTVIGTMGRKAREIQAKTNACINSCDWTEAQRGRRHGVVIVGTSSEKKKAISEIDIVLKSRSAGPNYDRPCKFYADNRCRQGDECPYIHDVADKPPTKKIKI